MTKDEALKLALEALEAIYKIGDVACVVKPDGEIYLQSVILKCREALAQPEQELVAWMDEEMTCIFFDAERPEPFDFNFWKPLYTTPPQRTWVGLTLDERIELAKDVDWAIGAYCEYAEKIEAKLKEKNT